MTTPLLSWSRAVAGLVVISGLLGAAPGAWAQGSTCPGAASCTPGPASSPQAAVFNMGILNVRVGNSIDRTSVGQAEGYQDLSCSLNAALTVGQKYALSVRTNASGANENVRVWIDYNNDGAFTGGNELVLSSDNNSQHGGLIIPPATAVLGTPLRLRVAADYVNSPVPTPCSTPVYSQDEDYSVTLSANTQLPMALFTSDATTTCTGCVQFTDASLNVPTGWLWNFGDGTTSTLQNPSHCYAAPGSYPVTLQASNANGTSTSAVTTIVYSTAVPAAATCAPQTLNYFANYGIVRFRLGTIDNASADGSAGYQDFTCTQRTDLVVGTNLALTVTTGGVNPHDIRVYLDQNNDGVLTAAELVFQSLNTPSPGATAQLRLPAGTVFDRPLRLRVVADAVGAPAGPCASPASGQAEDYTVVVRPNTLPPAVNFTSNYVPGGCVNPVQFTDLSANLPTAWLWNFGDGTTSTLQNPARQYTATGTYTVSLTATNAFGTNTVTRPNAVSVSVPCLTYCAANGTGGTGPGGVQQGSPLYITNVSVTNAQPAFSNPTQNASGGYGNYTAQPISIPAGGLVNLTVVTNAAFSHRTAVWVDVNTNGVFEASELLANGVTAAGPAAATFTTSFVVPAGAGGLFTRMRVLATLSGNAPNPCGVNTLYAEVEDYQLRVLPLATRDAQALPSLSLYPNPTADGHLRLHLADAHAAGPYAAEVQNVLGATVLRAALRLGPAADAELDLSALAPGVYVLRLRDAQGRAALRRVVRE